MLIEESFGISASFRGNKIFLKGDDQKISTAEGLIHDLQALSASGYNLRPEDIRYAIRSIAEGSGASLKDLFENHIPVSSKRRFIIPKTETQRRYLESIKDNDIVIGVGPAGTGKTYLAMAMAINAYLKKQISRIVLARPAIEAGEKLGFLPGDLFEKVNPYLRPLYDALFDMMEAEKATKLIERGVIEIAPLAFMRGRTAQRLLHHPRRGPEHHRRTDEDVPYPDGVQLKGGHHRRCDPDRPAAGKAFGPH